MGIDRLAQDDREPTARHRRAGHLFTPSALDVIELHGGARVAGALTRKHRLGNANG